VGFLKVVRIRNTSENVPDERGKSVSFSIKRAFSHIFTNI
jgi:hypothetical protein